MLAICTKPRKIPGVVFSANQETTLLLKPGKAVPRANAVHGGAIVDRLVSWFLPDSCDAVRSS